MTKDLSRYNHNRAVYTPALTARPFQQIHKHNKGFRELISEERVPAGFEKKLEGLLFFNKDAYYHYDYALYSAGHAKRDIEKSEDVDGAIVLRDRSNTTLIGDSGGYQIATGAINLPWDDFHGKKWNRFRDDVLRWLEHTCDISMTLDVPTRACSPDKTETTGLKSYKDCLELTKYNHEYFIEHRVPHKTKFLNTLHGVNASSSRYWYEQVRDYNNTSIYGERAFEGFAFAGDNANSFVHLLNRLIDLREDGFLDKEIPLHVLGNSSLKWAVCLTIILQKLRSVGHTGVSITYDSAGPFLAASKGAVYDYPDLTPDAWKYKSRALGATKQSETGFSDRPWHFEGAIGSRLSMRDINYNKVGDRTQRGELFTSAWDCLTYAMVAFHNLEYHLEGIITANNRFECEWEMWGDTIHFDDIEAYNVEKPQKIKISELVPTEVIYFARFIDTLFDLPADEGRALIERYNLFLNHLRGSRLQNVAEEAENSVSPSSLFVFS